MRRCVFLIGMAVLLAGCSTAKPAPAKDVHDPSLVFTDVTGCNAEGPRRQVCYDGFIKRYAGAKATRELLGELRTAMQTDPEVDKVCHSVAHAIGRLNFERSGNVQDALAQCDFTCFSGCLHGSVERVFFTEEQMEKGEEHADLETVKTAIPRLCLENEMPDSTPHTLKQCVHGVGHALLFALDYNLSDAFAMCELFPEDKRATCYTGVAMENISASDTRRRNLKPDNVLFPCDSLPDQYAPACYYYQPTYMMEQGMTMEQISERCLSVGKFAGDCIEGFSREFDLIYIRPGKTKNAVLFCEKLSGDFAARCIDSTIRSAVIAFNDGSSAYDFCGELTDEANRAACTRSVAGYFKEQLQWSSLQVRDDCHRFAGTGSALCAQTLSAYEAL